MTDTAPPYGACNLILCRNRRDGERLRADESMDPSHWIIVTRPTDVLGRLVNDFVVASGDCDPELYEAARSAKARYHATVKAGAVRSKTPADGVDLTATPVDGAQVDFPISTRHFDDREYPEYGVAIWNEDDGKYEIESRDHRRDVMERALARWREEHLDVPAILVERTIIHTAFRRIEEQQP